MDVDIWTWTYGRVGAEKTAAVAASQSTLWFGLGLGSGGCSEGETRVAVCKHDAELFNWLFRS
jgi:hypothetical protein